MPFQFLCPQGHLLQGDESQMGLQTQCPLCGVAFIIPHVAPQPAAQYPQQPAPGPGGYAPVPQYPQQQYVPQQPPPQPYAQQQAPAAPPQQQCPAAQAPRQRPPAEKKKRPPQQQPARDLSDELGSDLGKDLSSELGGSLGGGLGALDGAQDIDPTLFHIPCPNGHELETPVDMLGEEALCPHCGVQFRLLERDSLEYQHKQAIIDQQRAHFWFNWSIAAAVVVVIMLLAMLIVALRS